MIIRKKSSGIDYTAKEINYLRTLINISTLALQNSVPASEASHKTSIPAKDIQIKKHTKHDEIIGDSQPITKIKKMISKIAPNDATVLITGESGTGKELVARALHQKSKKAIRPLVTLNCAAIPDNLVESELFGHEKGAFTGAYKLKKGKFEIAHKSTLFLDEIGSMNLATQAKVLRVLQEKRIQRIGGHDNIGVDVRIIAATHKNLKKEIEQKNFRNDLYFRINVVPIHVPALRDRKDDIPVLADFFLQKYNTFYGKNIQKLHHDSLSQLIAYDYPGNIRELQNIIERAVVFEQSDQLTIDFPLLTSFKSKS